MCAWYVNYTDCANKILNSFYNVTTCTGGLWNRVRYRINHQITKWFEFKHKHAPVLAINWQLRSPEFPRFAVDNCADLHKPTRGSINHATCASRVVMKCCTTLHCRWVNGRAFNIRVWWPFIRWMTIQKRCWKQSHFITRFLLVCFLRLRVNGNMFFVSCIYFHAYPNNPLNYSKVVQKFIDNTFINGDDYVRRNLVELRIYLQSNTIAYVVESPTITLSQLLGNLGGVIGLYLGMTVVSAVELAEMLVLLIYVTIKRAFGWVDWQSEERNLQQDIYLFPNY